MKVHCIGVNSALECGKFDTNFVIDFGDDILLAWDVGRTWPEAMDNAGFDWKNLSYIYISHLHADHCGGMEWLAFNSYFKGDASLSRTSYGGKMDLIGSWEVLNELWDNCLKAGLQSIQGKTNSLENYFNVTKMPPNGMFPIYDSRVHRGNIKIVQTVHVIDDRRIKPSYGTMITTKKDNTLFITGDTQFCPEQIRTFYNQSDVIIQDCELANYPGSVHAQFDQLKTLPEEVKNKMWLTHYYGDDPPQEEARNSGFRGFLKVGQVIEVD